MQEWKCKVGRMVPSWELVFIFFYFIPLIQISPSHYNVRTDCNLLENLCYITLDNHSLFVQATGVDPSVEAFDNEQQKPKQYTRAQNTLDVLAYFIRDTLNTISDKLTEISGIDDQSYDSFFDDDARTNTKRSKSIVYTFFGTYKVQELYDKMNMKRSDASDSPTDFNILSNILSIIVKIFIIIARFFTMIYDIFIKRVFRYITYYNSNNNTSMLSGNIIYELAHIPVNLAFSFFNIKYDCEKDDHNCSIGSTNDIKFKAIYLVFILLILVIIQLSVHIAAYTIKLISGISLYLLKLVFSIILLWYFISFCIFFRDSIN